MYLVWGNALRQLTLATGIWADVPGVPLPYTGLLPAPDGGRWAILQHDAVLVDCACRALLIWDVAAQQTLASVPAGTSLASVAFRPDGQQVAWADAADVVTIVTVADPAAPVTLNYTVAQTAVTFGPPDTDAVFTGDWDGAGYTWSRSTGRVIDYTRPISDATGRNYIAATLAPSSV